MQITILQLIAYCALTLASVIVAIVSAVFGYRSNYGWHPLLIVTNHGFSGVGGSKVHNAQITFELWNRRKYPIVLVFATVEFANMKFEYDATLNGRNWYKVGGKFHYRESQVVAPAEHKSIDFKAPFTVPSLDDLDDMVTITVSYLDPIAGKYEKSKIRHPYHFKN